METRTAGVVTSQRIPHEHLWDVRSRHASSEGVVVYERCAGCGSWRVEVLPDRYILPETSALILRGEV